LMPNPSMMMRVTGFIIFRSPRIEITLSSP